MAAPKQRLLVLRHLSQCPRGALFPSVLALQLACVAYFLLLHSPTPPTVLLDLPFTKRAGWTHEGSRAAYPAHAVHIVTSWCSVKPEDPAMASLKSILLADAQHGPPEGAAPPLAFHVFTDAATERAWRHNAPMFRELRALLARSAARYSLRMLSVSDLDDVARRGYEAEAEAAGEDVGALPEWTRASQVQVSLDSARYRCAAARLLSPAALRDLERYIYLDYDTITLCDIRRLAGEFARFPRGAALGLASEFPSPTIKGGYYATNGIPTGVPNGLNSGVILFDLPALRAAFGTLHAFTQALADIIAAGVYAPYTAGKYSMAMPDQDVLNVLSIKYPGLVYVLSPTWQTIMSNTQVWALDPAFVPPAPCLVHFLAQRWRNAEPGFSLAPLHLAKEFTMVNPALAFVSPALPPLPVPPAAQSRLAQLQLQLQVPPLSSSLLKLLVQAVASFPPRPKGTGLLLCLVGGSGVDREREISLAGGVLLAAAQGAGLAESDSILAVLGVESSSAGEGGGLGAVRGAFPAARVAVGSDAAGGAGGCHVVLVSSGGGAHARAALAQGRKQALSGSRTFLVSADCSWAEGARAFDAAVARGEVDAVSRVEGAQFCAGWVVAEASG